MFFLIASLKTAGWTLDPDESQLILKTILTLKNISYSKIKNYNKKPIHIASLYKSMHNQYIIKAVYFFNNGEFRREFPRSEMFK